MVKIHSINTGFFRLDGGAMFGVIPRVLWEKDFKPDERNRILQALRVLLVIDGDRKILADVGVGNWHTQKFYDMYAIEKPLFDFNEALSKYDMSPDDITDIIITHLHFDHAGGLVKKTGSHIQPVFANARVWLQKQHWLWAKNPSPRDKGSFKDVYMDVIESWPRLELSCGQGQVADNVSVVVFNGHSPGSQAVLINDGTQKHFFASDLIPTVAHIHLPYITSYDNNAVLTAEEKKRILSRAYRENWLIYFPHDPVHEKGFITTENGKYILKKD